MPTVSPEPGEDMAVLAQTLLALADNPRTDVVYVPGDNLFSITDELADRYLASLKEPEGEAPAAKPAKKTAPKKATAKQKEA